MKGGLIISVFAIVIKIIPRRNVKWFSLYARTLENFLSWQDPKESDDA